MNKPDIVLVTVDCLRNADVEYVLDSVSLQDASIRSALKYKSSNHFSNAPFTAGAFKSLFGGELPLDGESGLRISSGSVTLAEKLQAVGYETIGVHSNPLLRDKSFARGFDIYLDAAGFLEESDWKVRLPFRGYFYAGGEILERIMNKLRIRYHVHVGAWRISKLALALARTTSKRKPMFLWIHYMDAHFPYGLSVRLFGLNREKRRRFLDEKLPHDEVAYWRKRYLNRLRYIGRNVSVFLKQIPKLRQEHTLSFILTSDHGEGFYEHGFVSHEAFLFDELVHVPVISNVPLLSQKKETASHLDLYWDIVNLASGKRGSAGSKTECVFMEVLDDLVHDNGSPIVGCRNSYCKIILDKKGAIAFDLRVDPQEHNPIPVKNGESPFWEFLLLAQKRYKSVSSRRYNYRRKTSPSIENRLRQLGYID